MMTKNNIVAPAPPAPPTPAKSVRILPLEDDPAHVEAIQRVFFDSGMKAVVQLARNLRDYRALTAAHPPDIAIVDLRLPDGNAMDILTSPAEAGPFPVVIMSGYGDERIAVEAMKAGAIDYIEKSSGAYAEMQHTVERSLRAWNVLQDRKRAEEQLRKSEEKYRVLFEGSTYGILATDIETRRFVFANPSMCRMLGYSAAELLKLGVADIHSKDALAHLMTGMETQIREGKALSSEIPCLRKDGTVFFADIGGASTIVNGRRCIVGFFADVTERRSAPWTLSISESIAPSSF
jgi:PAS domain S-box-containing protein